jgi:hypothetical protein
LVKSSNFKNNGEVSTDSISKTDPRIKGFVSQNKLEKSSKGMQFSKERFAEYENYMTNGKLPTGVKP